MKRIFAAIDIYDDARHEISNYTKKLRSEFSDLRVGWERAEKLHLTLKFFGDVDDRELVKIIEAAARTADDFSSFDLQITGTGAFPSAGNARVLWLGVKDDPGNLRGLNERFEEKFATVKFPKETRMFKPHLTIARLRELHLSSELVKKHLQNDFVSPVFSVSEIVVYESRLQKTGSIYIAVARKKLTEIRA